MNPWPFVIAAYAIALCATMALVAVSYTAMRRAETRLEQIGER